MPDISVPGHPNLALVSCISETATTGSLGNTGKVDVTRFGREFDK